LCYYSQADCAAEYGWQSYIQVAAQTDWLILGHHYFRVYGFLLLLPVIVIALRIVKAIRANTRMRNIAG
jgi:hypothetical protein